MSQNELEISCKVSSTCAGLNVAIVMDGIAKWQGDPWPSTDIDFTVDDAEAQHVLEIQLSGKTTDHTKIDTAGNILEDVTVSIDSVCFDQININQILYEKCQYHHDFNGTQSPITDIFYGQMGCNGRVRLEFTSPFYLWLLENM